MHDGAFRGHQITFHDRALDVGGGPCLHGVAEQLPTQHGSVLGHVDKYLPTAPYWTAWCASAVFASGNRCSGRPAFWAAAATTASHSADAGSYPRRSRQSWPPQALPISLPAATTSLPAGPETWKMIENSGSSRMNICIDPEPAIPNCSCHRESELPHLALAEFRAGAQRGLSSDLQTSAPAGITHEVMS